MTQPTSKRRFIHRPSDAESWVKDQKSSAPPPEGDAAFTARLTIDITPALRGRIKVAAFRRGITVAEMLRALLAREFPENDGDAP
ncbi:MAG TPA: hypothetical protein VMB81_16915 [Candidatus Sulfotelmatobacter sp.]|nr:hypothetical protein [Stellaceae bacterium]HUA53858.1 hypothetical protein [Candidatus Sulfotelmatobacter sp.]